MVCVFTKKYPLFLWKMSYRRWFQTFSKSCYEFIAVFAFTKKYILITSLKNVIPSMIWGSSQNYAMKSVRFSFFQNFQDLVDFQSRWSLRDYPRFFGDRNITLSLLLSNLSVVTFLARVITFLCSLLDDHFVNF